MKIYFLILILALFLFGCSTNIEKTNVEQEIKTKQRTTKQIEFAKQLFIDASILDVEGKYAEAILDYQEALKLDPSPGIYYAIAKDYLRLNKLASALSNSKKAVNLEKDNIEYLTLLGTIYSVSRNIDSAQTVFSKIVQLDSTNINAQFNLAQLYETDKPLKAIETYKKLIELTGPEWNVLVKIAALNERLGKVDETIKTVEALLELNPSNLQLKKLLVESYIKNEKYSKALNLVDETLKIFPDDLDLIELKGNALVKMKKWEAGAAEYKKIIDGDKTDFNTKLRIGTAFYSEALKDSVIIPYATEILTSVDKDSSDWQINAYLGELYNKEKNDSLTIFYFRKAIELAKLNVDLRIRFGQILFEKGDYANAAIEMEKAVKKFPRDFVINLILGLSLAQTSDHEGALPYLKKAVELNPNNLNSTLAYSFSLNQTKQNDEALIYLERALRIDPKNIQALGMMGLIYDSKKMFNKSDSLYNKAVSIDSTDILILNNFAYSLAERGVQLKRALKMVQKAVDKEPENSSYLDTIGWVYFQMGMYDSAKKYIDKAIEFDKSNATLLDHLGDVYYKMNDKQNAKQYWNKAIKLDSTLTKIKLKIEKGLD